MIAGLAAPILDYFLICFAKNKNELIKRESVSMGPRVWKRKLVTCVSFGEKH